MGDTNERAPTRRAEQILGAALSVGVLDCAYLTWRFVALQAGWVEPGTGLCSWSAGVDCDVVLSTPEARAFYVPNAVLGWGFFSGALLFWGGGRRRLPEALRGVVDRALAVWLGVATLLTFGFLYLMTQISALGPFCPWNHLWTWIACAASLALVRGGPPLDPTWREHTPALWGWVALCAGWCLAWQGAWLGLSAAGALGSGGPPPLFGS